MASLCINVLEGVSSGQILKAESSVEIANLTLGMALTIKFRKIVFFRMTMNGDCVKIYM